MISELITISEGKF